MKIGAIIMFNVGELIIYSTHGICQIDEICEKTYLDVTRTYYVLHPIENPKLTISTPIDNDAVVMLEMLHSDEAEEILGTFRNPGIDWVEKTTHRPQTYFDIIKTGNRKEIAKIVNTLMRKKHETELNGKKFNEHDRNMLNYIQNILFTELAIALNTTIDVVIEKADNMIIETTVTE